LDGDIRILAIVYCDTGYDTSNIVRSIHNEMSIGSIFAGILSIFTANETVDVSQKIYSALNTTAKIIEKTEKKEWEASTHEEGYQITKDTILKLGGLK